MAHLHASASPVGDTTDSATGQLSTFRPRRTASTRVRELPRRELPRRELPRRELPREYSAGRALLPCTHLDLLIRDGRGADLLLAVRAWGATLAALHRHPTQPAHPAPAPQPWILAPFDVPRSLRETGSAAADQRVRAVLRELQRSVSVRDAISAVRDRWQSSCWTHGNPVGSNVVARPLDRYNWHAWLVDEHAAGLSDPSWDLATAYDSLLMHRRSLRSSLRPAIRALLDGYRCGDGPGALNRELLITRAALTCFTVISEA